MNKLIKLSDLKRFNRALKKRVRKANRKLAQIRQLDQNNMDLLALVADLEHDVKLALDPRKRAELDLSHSAVKDRFDRFVATS